MTKKQETKENTSFKLDIFKIYDECEKKGVSKEIISGFLKLQRRIRDAQNISGS
ncbi:hypothetical protein [Bacillus sp. B1-b2]|uniref:hypothetical protein n=1 Tax=Bacillus sp. B1-b2 TaxID=2653201 RepID=UPI0018697AF0|nr:hypothetical protein [Bacillus sp. B1-b2]